MIAAAPTSWDRADGAGRAWRGLPQRPPRRLWERPRAKGAVDVEGTEMARRGRPPAQTAPGAAAAAAAAVRAAPKPPRAASRAALSYGLFSIVVGCGGGGGVLCALVLYAPAVPALQVNLVLMYGRVRRVRHAPSGRCACIPGSPFV